MSNLRGRRTRVYDCNYNKGESYYKPTLDKLDRKYSGRPDISEAAFAAPRARLNLDDSFIDDDTTRNRQFGEEPFFDSRGGRAHRGIPLSAALDNDIDEEVQASLNRFRSSKSKLASLINDDDDDTFSSMKRRAKLPNFGEDEEFIRPSIRSHARKLISDDDTNEGIGSSMVSSFKRTQISSTDDVASESINSAASMRAQATKARLADIETEMTDRSNRQLERENRAANLKKILAENDIEVVQKSSSKHVSF